MIPRDPTLLVVEDSKGQAVLLRVVARLAHPELDVRVAGDGRECVAYLSGTAPFQDRVSHPYPDLIILDLFMPGMDGFAVLEWIRAHQGSRSPPVAVLTSSENSSDRARALELGANAFHTKPADPEELRQVVHEIVQEWIP